MSHEAAPQEADAKAKKKSGPGLMVWLVIAILAIGGGVATPVLAAKFLGSNEETEEGHGDGEHGEEGEHGEHEEAAEDHAHEEDKDDDEEDSSEFSTGIPELKGGLDVDIQFDAPRRESLSKIAGTVPDQLLQGQQRFVEKVSAREMMKIFKQEAGTLRQK
jgi:ABC-type Zn2+ transport system substrate-binding protein/surface adhesin